MTIDVPLLADIQNACQFSAGKSSNKINGFSVRSILPNAAACGLPAEILATAMISCAAQHRQQRW
ncbi:hypothetical protein QMZ05_09295 [Bradyrhizobium sp. INPA03-11B]|uniref:hypothetical protein n=1 Tax=Bradyrhizobium sp. INPA03-11B TaxID=418598 RepID=UPI0033906CBC